METKGKEVRDPQGKGKWAALTFLVLPRALREEQLVLSIWKVGWKKLIHEGAGRKDKAGWQTGPPRVIAAPTHPRSTHLQLFPPGTLTAALMGRTYQPYFADGNRESK